MWASCGVVTCTASGPTPSISSWVLAKPGTPVASMARARACGSVSATPTSSRPSISRIASKWTTETSPHPITPMRTVILVLLLAADGPARLDPVHCTGGPDPALVDAA